jgi:hypothetical protein
LKIANLGLSAQLAVAEKNLKGYEYATALQNEGIKQLQAAGVAAKLKSEEAIKVALAIRKQRQDSAANIMKKPAPVACEEARAFGFDLAKQLVEGRQ